MDRGFKPKIETPLQLGNALADLNARRRILNGEIIRKRRMNPSDHSGSAYANDMEELIAVEKQIQALLQDELQDPEQRITHILGRLQFALTESEQSSAQIYLKALPIINKLKRNVELSAEEEDCIKIHGMRFGVLYSTPQESTLIVSESVSQMHTELFEWVSQNYGQPRMALASALVFNIGGEDRTPFIILDALERVIANNIVDSSRAAKVMYQVTDGSEIGSAQIYAPSLDGSSINLVSRSDLSYTEKLRNATANKWR